MRIAISPVIRANPYLSSKMTSAEQLAWYYWIKGSTHRYAGANKPVHRHNIAYMQGWNSSAPAGNRSK
jgi:hypothetical protein